jgi:hypothetical protein
MMLQFMQLMWLAYSRLAPFFQSSFKFGKLPTRWGRQASSWLHSWQLLLASVWHFRQGQIRSEHMHAQQHSFIAAVTSSSCRI